MKAKLRDQLLQTCWRSGASVDQVMQAMVDVLMLTLVAVGPDADTAECNIQPGQ